MTTVTDLVSSFRRGHPTLLVDADEVILRFMEHLELHCNDNGFDVNLESFRLSGNIIHRQSGVAATQETVKELIASFFDERVNDIPPVAGAAEALSELSNTHQIAVLTNIPHKHRERREESLHNLGFPYPVLANSGEKGPAVKTISDALEAPITFIDDLPPQLASVAAHAPHTHLVHFVADPRLAKLIPKAEAAHVRIDKWHQLKEHLMSQH